MSKDIRKIVKRQLPIIDADKVESTWYALRMTPLGAYTTEDLEGFIKTISETYVFTHELSKKEKEHYHCVINSELDDDEMRIRIRGYLKKYFPKPKRGDANIQYNLSECIDVETSIIYLLKDVKEGDKIFMQNMKPESVNELRKKSYVKPDTKEFTDKLNVIKQQVKEGELREIPEIMTAIVKLKSFYRQPINMNYIYQLSLSLYLNVNSHESNIFVSNFLSRIY